MSIPYVYAEGVDYECCIASDTNKKQAVCGRLIGFRPVVPPMFPATVHYLCQQRWEQRGRYEIQVDVPYGTCPDCGGDIPLDDAGMVEGHKAWVQTRHGVIRSGNDCPGAGQLPVEAAPAPERPSTIPVAEVEALLNAPTTVVAECPACRVDQPLDGERFASHTVDGMPCLGVNMRPRRKP